MATGADIHGKLAEYRARKAREYREETQKRNFWGNVGYVQGGTQVCDFPRPSRIEEACV